ncbi:uncharacterized protein [Littorina saxatilis]|uniref:uncharacterized protein n=1 Tax=Littorina saxatilis TaxID=31220 RepID=UPI0038B526FF
MVTGTLHFAISKDCLDDMGTSQSRAKREFVPEFKKDIQYWSKRHKNNISARRSRVKRKTIEKLMEHRMLELQSENMELRRELGKLQTIFGLPVTKTPAPSSSPAGSPGSSSSSSGIGNSSTGAPSLHSNSSSPAQCVEEEKGKKAGYQQKVKLTNAGQNGNVINKSCEREGGPGYRAGNAHSQSASSLSPPAAHFSSAPQPKPSSLSDSGAYPPAAHANNVSRKNSLPASYRHPHRNNAPPAAHSSSSAGSSDNCPASTFAKSYPSYSSPLYSSTHSSFPVYPGAHRSGSGHNYSEFFAKGGSSSSSSSCSSPSATTNGGCSYQPHVRSASTSASSRFAAAPMTTSHDYSPPHYMASQGDSSTNTSTSSSSCSYLPNHHHLLPRSHHGSAASDASSESSGSSSLRPNSLSDHRDRSSSFSNSPCMSDGSSGASGGSPVLVSEDDASSGSGESRRSSRNSFEEESFHKIPLKCRMKRGLYSPYNKVNVKARKDFV